MGIAEAHRALKDTKLVGLDATPAGHRLYQHFGFESTWSLVRMKTRIDAARFGSSTGGVRLMDHGDLAEVLRRDREVFGADRSHLLTTLQKRAPDCAWIVTCGGRIRGYSFGRPGELYYQLGPIVAERGGVARDLAAHCLPRFRGRPFVVDVAQQDEEWTTWLRSVGFVEERPFTRMFRFGGATPGDPARQYAIVGPEFG